MPLSVDIVYSAVLNGLATLFHSEIPGQSKTLTPFQRRWFFVLKPLTHERSDCRRKSQLLKRP